jgi:hypothetical protein
VALVFGLTTLSEDSNMSSFDPGSARQRVSGPATGLLITGIIGIVVQGIGLVMNLAGVGAAAVQPPPAPGAPDFQWQAYTHGPIAITSAIIGLVIGIVIVMGALKMKNLQSYGLAMTSSILAMIPCISPCCLLGLPIGIWSVVVLSKPEVKSAFRG